MTPKKPPERLKNVLKRAMHGAWEGYRYWPIAEAPHIFRYKADYKFNIQIRDMETLIEFGLVRIQVNELGYIDLYFIRGT